MLRQLDPVRLSKSPKTEGISGCGGFESIGYMPLDIDFQDISTIVKFLIVLCIEKWPVLIGQGFSCNSACINSIVSMK